MREAAVVSVSSILLKRNGIVGKTARAKGARARLRRALDTAREDVFAGMISADVLVQVAALLSPVGTVRTLELRFLAALVPRVPQQGGAMLVTLAALFAAIREAAALLGHPQRSQVLERRHRVDAIPLHALVSDQARRH